MKQSNSFKPEKCLLYRENLEGILDRNLLPPVEVNIDPINDCTLKCKWCNAKRVLDGKQIDTKIMLQLIDELADWGVKAICFAGGGEPSLHPDLSLFIKHCTKKGLESAIITNGYSWSDELIETMADNMKWIGVSVDAANKKTFKKLKGIDGFIRTIKNIDKLIYYRNIDPNCKVGVTFKYLIHPKNQHEIYDAALVAKDLHCDSFHLRPVDFLAYQKEEEQLNVDLINGQVEKGLFLTDDKFEFIPFFACFNKVFRRNIKFDKCILSPLLGICLPDGWWLCIDRKGHKGLKMCNILGIRKFWGSEKHFEIMDKIAPKKDCGKCTLSKYYSYVEAYRNDEYYWKFV